MFHFPDLEWTRLQAEAMGVPQYTAHTEGIKEEELEDLRRALSGAKERFAIEEIFTGALASVYQKTRVEKVCSEVGLECISPLWGVDPERHLRRLIADGFDVMVGSVSALGLDRSGRGRVRDGQAVDELVALGRKFRINVGLDGGEGETYVLDCPLFGRRVEVLESTEHWHGDSGYLEISKASLAPKAGRKA